MHARCTDLLILICKADHKSLLLFIYGNDFALTEVVGKIQELKTRDPLFLEKRLQVLYRKLFKDEVLVLRRDNVTDNKVYRLAIGHFLERTAKPLLDVCVQLMRSHDVRFQVAIENARII